MTSTLTATKRTQIGTRLNDLRAAGSIPAVMYGKGLESQSIQLNASEFQKVYRKSGMSSLIDVALDGGAPIKVLIQEIQVNPLTMKPQHVDLRQIQMNEELTVSVPVVFINESPAVKELAGTLVHSRDELEVRCLPANLPHELTVDLSTLKTFDDMITIADLVLPAGVTVTDDPAIVIATVSAPLTEDQLKKMEEASQVDVTAVKTEAEEKKAAEEAKAAEEKAVDGAPKT